MTSQLMLVLIVGPIAGRVPRIGFPVRKSQNSGAAAVAAGLWRTAFPDRSFGKLGASSRTSLIWDFLSVNRWSERE